MVCGGEVLEKRMNVQSQKMKTCVSARRAAIVCTLLAAFLCRGSARAQDDCKVVHEAYGKMVVTPTHIYVVETSDANKHQPTDGEMIYTGGAEGSIFLRVEGKWKPYSMNVSDVLKLREENSKKSNGTCKFLREEAVNGEAAVVYQTRGEAELVKVDQTVWISKSRGLPLREQMDMNVAKGVGKIHREMRYEYKNVKAPEL
jgi:hypothetical protein